jgi:hypothetical protein
MKLSSSRKQTWDRDHRQSRPSSRSVLTLGLEWYICSVTWSSCCGVDPKTLLKKLHNVKSSPRQAINPRSLTYAMLARDPERLPRFCKSVGAFADYWNRLNNDWHRQMKKRELMEQVQCLDPYSKRGLLNIVYRTSRPCSEQPPRRA